MTDPNDAAEIGALREIVARIARGDAPGAGPPPELADSSLRALRDDLVALARTFAGPLESPRLEEALRIAQFSVDHARDAIYWVGEDSRFLRVNEAACRALGYAQEELLRLGVYDIDPEFPTGCWPEHWDRLRAAGSLVVESVHRRKDGSCFPVEIVETWFELGGREYDCAFARDLTARKRLERAAQMARKMDAIGTLAGGIAHDFNNLLTAIGGSAALMLRQVDPQTVHAERLETILRQVTSGADLVRQLLGYARKGRYEVRTVDMNELVSDVSRLIARARKNVEVEIELAPDLATVQVDRTQFERVLLNLTLNAADAMPRGGSITLRTMNATHEDIEPASFVPVPGPYVCVAIRDTGTGMDEATRERVFDPFFTTKGPGEGSGLGLATVYGIVKGHEGYVEVESAPGAGSEFRVFLPASDRVTAAEASAAPVLLRPGSGSILVVDDEADVLSVIQDLLLELGYEVTTAGSGAEAIALYNAAEKGFDLVILDMIMPGMGGDEVFDALRRIDPDVKVLLASGYARGDKARALMEKGCAGFLEKPFLFEELSEKVDSLIAAPRW